MALTRRSALVERMHAEAGRADAKVSATCFEILCGLSAETQLAAAVHAMKRFLPLHERMRPGSTRPRRALDDPGAWFEEHGRESPLEQDPAPLAESTFDSAFDGLLLARAFSDDPYTLTSGCVYAIANAVSARAHTVWMADEPLVDGMFEAAAPLVDRPDPLHNVAWLAVTVREWGLVANWLARPEVVEAADPLTSEQIAALLEKWLAHEEIIIVPRSASQQSDPRPIAWDAVDARVEARVASGDPTPLEQILAEEIDRTNES